MGGQGMSGEGAGMMVGMPTRHEPAGVILAMPMMNSNRGMALFVEKGCVTCHAVNGVGGHDATALDAHAMANVMNPFDLAAKMWDVAPYMIAAQEEAFGEQLHFTGEELADIIAFVHDDGVQHRLTEEMITPRIRKMMDHGHGAASGMDEHADEIGHGPGKGKDEDAGHDD
ncbi:MAG: c-type cytochrome [Rhodospirillaceae bacterium]|nr:c-type cytochrome [Rhodospirillaceae bacterium]